MMLKPRLPGLCLATPLPQTSLRIGSPLCSVRSAMRAASQVPGKGPTDVDDAPAPAR